MCRNPFRLYWPLLILLQGLFCFSVSLPQPDSLENGDLVARYTDSWLSRLSVQASDGDREFSHIGILYDHPKQGWMVIHSLPRGDLSGVYAEPLDRFLEPAIRYGFYHVNRPPEEKNRFTGTALVWSQKNISFDHQFDLENDQALYCTELIWKLAKETMGSDLHITPSTTSDRTYLSVEDILRSPYLKRIDEDTAAEDP